MTISKELLEILACPDCKSELRLNNDKLICKRCEKEFEIKDDIPLLTD